MIVPLIIAAAAILPATVKAGNNPEKIKIPQVMVRDTVPLATEGKPDTMQMPSRNNIPMDSMAPTEMKMDTTKIGKQGMGASSRLDSITGNTMKIDNMEMGDHKKTAAGRPRMDTIPGNTKDMGEMKMAKDNNNIMADTMPANKMLKKNMPMHKMKKDNMAMDADTMHHKMNMKTGTMASTAKPKVCVKMENGKMMQMKDGKMIEMDRDLQFKNGAVVMKNGTMKMKDGKTHKLKNGDCVMMDGSMIMMPQPKKKKIVPSKK